MKFTIATEPGTRKTAFGVIVPDLPGCFSAGDTVERFFGPAEKINITVPGRLLKQIEEHARAHGETRSGFLTKSALEAMRRA